MEVKNVVIVNDFNYIQGGASKVAIDTARLLANKGIKVYFFSAVNKTEDQLNGIEYITTNQKEALKEKNKIKGIINGIYNFKAKKELKKLLERLDKESTIIHIHGWTKALSSSIFDIIKKKKFTVIVTIHDYFLSCPNGGFFNYKENKVCLINSMSLKCITCNCDSRNYFIKLYRIIRQLIQNRSINGLKAYAIYVSKFSKGKTTNKILKKWNSSVVMNPINFKRMKLNLKDNGNYVFLGRISQEKGVELFCKAVMQTKVKGIIIGDGPLKNELENKYKEIEFLGWQENEKIKSILYKSRALIFTSLWYETMGLTALEAMSLGIPVISGDNCATASYIDDNITGLIYKSGDLEGLCKKIEIMEDKEKYIKIKKMLYKRYWNDPPTSNKYIENIMKIYDGVINEKNIDNNIKLQ